MAIIEAMVVLAKTSGLPEDAVQNTFHFEWPGAPPISVDFDNLRDDIEGFYNSVGLGNVMGYGLSRAANANLIKFYTLPAVPGPSGSPTATRTWTLVAATPGGSSLPDEVAMCMSFRGSYTGLVEEEADGDRPRSRTRNRVFLGPWTTFVETLGTSAVGDQRVNAATRATIVAAAAAQLGAAAFADGWIWQTWSRTDWDGDEVEEVWVDDAFDTQRRRGVAPSTRSSAVV